MLNENIITEIANKYHKTNAQVILKWHIQMGFVVIPGSKNVDHIKDNFDLFDFELSNEDMNKIDILNKNIRYYNGTKEDLNRYAMWQPTYEKE